MAVANTLSNVVTQADAVPQRPIDPALIQGPVFSHVATVEVAAADDDNSVYRLFRVHSSWSPRKIEIFNDAITGGSDYDLGVHETAENGGAVKDANLFGDAISMASARVAPLDATHEILGIENIEKSLWEMLGETEDPDRWYDITLTGITVGTAAGTISGRLWFAING